MASSSIYTVAVCQVNSNVDCDADAAIRCYVVIYTCCPHIKVLCTPSLPPPPPANNGFFGCLWLKIVTDNNVQLFHKLSEVGKMVGEMSRFL